MTDTGLSPRFGSLAQSVRALGYQASRPLVAARIGPANAPLKFSPLVPSIIVGSAFLHQKGMQAAQPNRNDTIPPRRLLVESFLGYFMAAFSPGIVPFLYGLGLTSYRAGKQDNALDKLHSVVNTATTLTLGYLGVLLFSGLSDAQRQAENKAIESAWNNPELASWRQKLASHPEPAAQELSLTLKSLALKLNEYDQAFQNKKATSSEALQLLKEEVDELKASAADRLQALDEALIQPKEEAVKAVFLRFRKALAKSQYLTHHFARLTNPLMGYVILGLLLGTGTARDINRFLDRRFPQLRQKKILTRMPSQENTLIPREFSFRPILPPVNNSLQPPSA